MKNCKQLKHHGFTVFLFICLLLLLRPVCQADPSRLQEYRIKAAFLYNFANFVEWPPNTFAHADTPIVIGVLGENQLVEILQAANLKPIRGRKFLAKKIENMTNFEFCHMLFVDHSQKDNVKQILNNTRFKNILTVGDAAGFIQEGGVINFVEVDNQVRFEINVQAAKSAHLVISSKLLNLAIWSTEENK